jgi:AmmeMemoRadiSam system protein B
VFVIRDPFKIQEGQLLLPAAGLALATLFDGTRTLAGVQAEFQRRYEVQLPLEAVETLLEGLERALLIEGPALDAALARYHAEPERPAACIGSYPGEREELAAFLAAQWTREGGPGGPPASGGGSPIRGVVSPHIDPQRGGHVYAHAWRAVAESCPAELFVVFGTSHTGTAPPSRDVAPARFALTRKAFQTPAGTVPVDQALVDDLLAAYQGTDDLLAGELHHKGEHSIEFQVVYLAHLFAGRRPLRILPVLCGSLADLAGAPGDDPRLISFHAALREALQGVPRDQVAFVAGIDLAHVGADFHQPPIGEPALEQVATADRETLRLLTEERSAAALHHDVRRDDDARSICGHAPLVALLQALEGQDLQGELLRYDRWYDGESAVSFASAVFRDP